MITEIEGVVEDIKLAKDRQQEIVVKGANETRSYLASGTSRLKVEVGQSVERGEVLTEGSIEPKNFLAVWFKMRLKVTYLKKFKSLSYARCRN